MEHIHNINQQLHTYAESYFAHVREGLADLSHIFELAEDAEISNAFIITAMILTPLFGTLLFLIILAFSG